MHPVVKAIGPFLLIAFLIGVIYFLLWLTSELASFLFSL